MEDIQVDDVAARRALVEKRYQNHPKAIRDRVLADFDAAQESELAKGAVRAERDAFYGKIAAEKAAGVALFNERIADRAADPAFVRAADAVIEARGALTAAKQHAIDCRKKETTATSAKHLAELETATRFAILQVNRVEAEHGAALDTKREVGTKLLSTEAVPIADRIAGLTDAPRRARAEILKAFVALAPLFEIAGMSLRSSSAFDFFESMTNILNAGGRLAVMQSGDFDSDAVEALLDKGRVERQKTETAIAELSPMLAFLQSAATLEALLNHSPE